MSWWRGSSRLTKGCRSARQPKRLDAKDCRWCRLFEVPAAQAATSVRELQIEKRHQSRNFASADDFPKFVKSGRCDGTRTSESGHQKHAGNDFPPQTEFRT